MQPTDKKHRPYLRDYIARSDKHHAVGTLRSQKIICPGPGHSDSDESCQINEETLFCYGCGFVGDIYDLAGIDNGLKTFREQSDFLDSFFGNSPPPPTKMPEQKEPTRGRAVPLHPDKAKTSFSLAAIKRFADFLIEKGMKLKGEPEEPVFYRNKLGMVEAADVRFVDGDKKDVIMFWWNGRSLVIRTPPLLIWGRDILAQQPELPVLIVEGAKCAQAAQCIPEMATISWSHGTQNAGRVDWSILKDRAVFIYPDDDDPGQSAAKQIKLKLPQAVIVEPLEAARKIKEKGADIVEALQVLSPTALAHYIQNYKQPEPDGPTKGEWKPFTILGTADDKRLYCVDRHGRLQNYDCQSITKTKLLTLADLLFWGEMFPKKGGFDVDEATNWLISEAEPDFDTDSIRGRGAWSEKNGDICYHDGKVTTGRTSPKRMYIRKVRKDIGINKPHAAPERIKQIKDLVLKMSFETRVDACMSLCWSILAPFGGALPWRQAILITGESGSGKSAVMRLLIRPLSAGMAFSGGGTTEAGIRQAVQNDSSALIVEEAEGDTQTKRAFREALFSLMRQCTSDDAPQIAKGTAGDQRGLKFNMSNMFCFLSIDPEIEFSADDNRIFRINMLKASKTEEDWFKNAEIELEGLLDESTSNGIRALTYSRLPEIIALGRRIAPIVRDCSGRDMRFGLAGGLLWAAYWLVWDGRESVTDEFVREFLKRAYGTKPEEPRRNDAGEMVGRIMDQVVEISGDTRRKMTIREGCMYIRDSEFEGDTMGPTMISEVLNTLSRLGVRVMENGDVAFASRHHELQKILNGGTDYGRSLARHPGMIERAKRVRLNGAQRLCVVISGVLEEKEKPKQVEIGEQPDPTGRVY